MFPPRGYKSWKKQQFCSQKCHVAAMKAGKVFKRGPDHGNWKPDAEITDRTLRARGRKLALATRPDYCERCGLFIAQEVHHKDRDWRNYDPSNLEWLCITCHDFEHATK